MSIFVSCQIIVDWLGPRRALGVRDIFCAAGYSMAVGREAVGGGDTVVDAAGAVANRVIPQGDFLRGVGESLRDCVGGDTEGGGG